MLDIFLGIDIFWHEEPLTCQIAGAVVDNKVLGREAGSLDLIDTSKDMLLKYEEVMIIVYNKKNNEIYICMKQQFPNMMYAIVYCTVIYSVAELSHF